MMRRAAMLALASCTALAGGASAAALDGKDTLVCTFASAAECDTDAQCAAVTREDLGLPESFNIDFKGKRSVAGRSARARSTRSRSRTRC